MKFFYGLILAPLYAEKVDPCWFVGLRLVKHASVCKDGICEGIGRVGDTLDKVTPGSTLITCEEAAGMVEDFTTERTSEEQDSKRQRREELDLASVVDKLTSVVIPEARRMGLEGGIQPFDPLTIAAMGEIDRSLLRAFREMSEEEWSTAEASIRASAAFESLVEVRNLISIWSQRWRSPVDLVVRKRAPFVHFLLDIMSLFGRPVHLKGMLYLLREAQTTPVAHRPKHVKEILRQEHFRSFNEFPLKDFKLLARLIDKLAVTRKLELGILGGIYWIDSLPSREQSAAAAILRRKVQTLLCPLIDQIVGSLLNAKGYQRQMISFISLCRGFTSRVRLTEASVLLFPKGEAPEWLLNENEGLIIDNLKRNDISWVGGFSRLSCAPAQASLVGFIDRYSPLIKKGSYNVLKPKSHFDSAEDFENTMRGLGRAIALSARNCEQGGKELGMEKSDFMAIMKEPTESETFMSAQQRDEEVESIHEAMFFVRMGITDVLGLAGLYVFTLAEWERYGS